MGCRHVIAKKKKSMTSKRITFAMPGGWTSRMDGEAHLFEVPNEDIRICIFEAKSKTSDSAVEEAWLTHVPGFQKKRIYFQNEPARDGWEEIQSYGYETPIAE